MDYVLYFDFAAVILMVALGNHFFYSKTIKNQRLNIFGVLIMTISLATVLDITSVLLNAKMWMPVWSLYVLNAVYLQMVSFVTCIFVIYVYIICNDGKVIGVREYLIASSLEMVYGLLLLLTPINHWIFYIDENHRYWHGKYSYVMYVVAVLYILFGILYAYRNRRKLSAWTRFSLLFYPFAMILVIILQILIPNILLMQFVEAIACQLIIFSIENPQDYKNKEFDIYNTKAFREAFQYEVAKNRGFKMLFFKVAGIKSVNDLMGINAGREALKVVIDYMIQIVNRRKFYYLDDDILCIMADYTDEEWAKIREQIIDRFRRSFEVDRIPLTFDVYMCMVSYPDKAACLDDAIEMMSYALRESESVTHKPIVYADANILEQGHRETQIAQVLKNAVKEKKFIVYYQPIFNVNEGRATRAEALVRLVDEEMGFISPDEFIPIAERNGLIVDIDSIVLNEVCRFVSENKLWEKGLDKIDINLSAVQCMQEDLSNKIIDVMDAYKVPYKMFNLEITETAAIASEENLRRNMEKLMSKGVNFSVDDYGTGFSNVSTIIDYPFTVVKIDKNMLWKAMKNRQAMMALKHTIEMLFDMGLEIVTEGIEDKDMAELLRELHCYLHQGFYYSRPIPAAQFLEYIDR
ncbi:MAG: GGDEF domain-containing protein [Lachnospiraceae bacterium]|nr:GGDEF domain-containing protein [Lachnospiraceae bacterium]MBR5788948.1 GGDEF domain-containing protein [Lachnospiraceae bacterium]